jgi:hypothetical protein
MLNIEQDELWSDYYRLQWYDRISLAFCLNEWDNPSQETITVGDYTLTPKGPWRASITPFPFNEKTTMTLLRTKYEQKPRTQANFLEEVHNKTPEEVTIVLEED